MTVLGIKKTKPKVKYSITNTVSILNDSGLCQAKEYFRHKDTILFEGDALNKHLFNKEFVDLTVTSPPYNVGIQYNSHKDELTYEDYLEFSKRWIQNCFKWTKPQGRLILNIPLDKNKGGQRSVGADLTAIAQKVGWKYHSTIIWNEGNISRRTAWGSWLSASAPFVIAPVELIVVLYKCSWKKITGSKISDIKRQEFMDWTNGVWTFNGESGKRIGHPAPFPRELPHRAIKLFSFVRDVVFDPFCGSGTTLIEAANNNRIGIGVEIDKHYCELSKNRILNETGTLNFPKECYEPKKHGNGVYMKISSSNPYKSLINDLFSLPIFDKAWNGSLTILRKNDVEKTIFIERQFINTSDKTMNAGFFFIQCFDEIVTDEHLCKFRSSIETIVKEKTQGNYMDINPILIAPDFSNSVMQFINDYNRMQNRQCIETYHYSK